MAGCHHRRDGWTSSPPPAKTIDYSSVESGNFQCLSAIVHNNPSPYLRRNLAGYHDIHFQETPHNRCTTIHLAQAMMMRREFHPYQGTSLCANLFVLERGSRDETGGAKAHSTNGFSRHCRFSLGASEQFLTNCFRAEPADLNNRFRKVKARGIPKQSSKWREKSKNR
jgi:hypothetical protein